MEECESKSSFVGNTVMFISISWLGFCIRMLFPSKFFLDTELESTISTLLYSLLGTIPNRSCLPTIRITYWMQYSFPFNMSIP